MPEDLALPRSIVAGTTVTYRRTYGEFPASDGWALKLFIGGPGTPRTFDAVADGDDFVVTLSAEDTAGIDPGDHLFAERVEKAAEVHQPAEGRVFVKLNLASADADAGISFLRKLLPVLEQAILTQTKRGLAAYTVGGVALQKLDWEQLVKYRSQIVAAINAEIDGGLVVRELLIVFAPE